MADIPFKKEVHSLLSNPIITGLIRDKIIQIDNRTKIELTGDLNFSLRMDGERLVVDIHDVKPKVTAKRFLRFDGRISSVSIGHENVIISIDNLPDVTLNLVDEV